jgi:hypothetical protein
MPHDQKDEMELQVGRNFGRKEDSERKLSKG